MTKMITLGGNRLGSGNRMKVALDRHERSTSNLSERFFSSMAPGLLVPAYVNLVLPGDTWNIKIDAGIFTKPTLGPMFSTLKFEVHFFYAQFRLYNGALHNDALNSAMNMNTFKFAKIKWPIKNNMEAIRPSDKAYTKHAEEDTFSKSSLNAYMGYPSLPFKGLEATPVEIEKFGVQYLMYADIFKNAYANKQETNAYVMDVKTNTQTVYSAEINGFGEKYFNFEKQYLSNEISTNPDIFSYIYLGSAASINDLKSDNGFGLMIRGRNLGEDVKLQIRLSEGGIMSIPVKEVAMPNLVNTNAAKDKMAVLINVESLKRGISNWNGGVALQKAIQTDDKNAPYSYYIRANVISGTSSIPEPVLTSFPLENLDKIRRMILADNDGNAVKISKTSTTPVTNTINFLPLSINCDTIASTGDFKSKYPLVGMFAKTYQADIFNAWLKRDIINSDVKNKTRIDVSGGYLNIDSLIMGRKLFNLYTQTALSGGTTSDWRVAMWGIEDTMANEVPIYLGGLSTEIYFQEVTNVAGGESPLGNLAGKGRFGAPKGGRINLKAKEEGLIMAIASITPRIAYSQGERWFGDLDNMQQLHTDKLDGIGFQDVLQVEQAAWSSQMTAEGTNWLKPATGKVPAWMWYRTAVDRVYGDLAELDKQNYMVFTRNYQAKPLTGPQTQGGLIIEDNTTYIDPAKYNSNFAEAARDAQNFWVLIDFKIKVRRIGSTSIIPHA